MPQDCETACEFSVGLGALLLLLVGLLGRGCSVAGVALRAVGGVWSACGALWGLWGLMAVLWAGAEECCSDGAGAGILYLLTADC